MGNVSAKHKTTSIDKRELGDLSIKTGIEIEELKVKVTSIKMKELFSSNVPFKKLINFPCLASCICPRLSRG